ncbi:predicted protein [Nematostella vectensis]|uniref:G-protein coupled receptors family 1 profile domain-containing protein n=1 Tax=Nematostella vectensis TaxID=45351 RepID=A7RQX6_NEMVE|nr:rhodopsin [Nematostella vectensis]EDO46179.1 predicted protein [Nematostella vectensis]|eukprot:XP_001638242.1 predicted protein [Nematostella vectensis]
MNVTKTQKTELSLNVHSNIQVDVSGILTIILEAMTFLCNILPACAVFQPNFSRERTITDCFIGALALNDLVSVAVPLSVGIPTLWRKKWVGSRLSCELYQASTVWFQLNAMMLVTAMSCDRFFSLKPLAYQRDDKKKRSRLFILICSISGGALLISLLPILGLGNTGVRKSGLLTYCPCILIIKPTSTKENIFPVVLLLLGYSTFISVSFCNFTVLRLLSSFKTRWKRRELIAGRARQDRRDVAACAKLVGVLALLFYLTWTPAMVLLTLNQTRREVNEITAVYAFTSLTINSLAHPLVYGIFSAQFRQRYQQLVSPLLRLQQRCWFSAKRAGSSCCSASGASARMKKARLRLRARMRETAI